MHPYGYLRLAAVLAAVLVPVTADSQDRSVFDRLDRIERDLNMLQRQVYRGAPPSAVPGADPNSAASVEIRMEQLEEEMRQLTGKVEQVANGLEQLRQRVEQINSDLDVRFGQMASAGGAPPPSRSAPPGAPPPPSAARSTGGGPAPGTVVPPPSDGAGLTPIFGTLTPPGAPGPRPPTGAPPPGAAEQAAAGAGLPPGSAMDQFNFAFGLVKQANYADAEVALREFIRQHPSDPQAASAQYWLGETYYQRTKYQEAAAAYAEGYKRYPRGAKAPEELLKLAMSLAHLDQKKNACVALTQLDHEFPNPSAAIKQQSAAEKKRIGC
jgi:tol-pal system protein YbgF